MIRVRPLFRASVAVASLLVSRAAFAGPPLLCFPFDIGSARTIPMGTNGWHSVDPSYDASRLIDDTLALLAPDTPVVVRMETLRRATVYASTNPKIANALLTALQERASTPHANVGLNVFDFGYLVETYRQAKSIFSAPVAAIDRIDGYQLVLKAHALQGDPAMQFAAAVMTEGNSATRTESRGHLERARAHADADPTLARNISRHFQ
jgi:hypothetical protein